VRGLAAGLVATGFLLGIVLLAPATRADSWTCGGSAYASDPLSELVVNGGFENNMTGWWTVSPTALPTISTTIHHFGAKSAHVLDDGNPGNMNAAENVSSVPSAYVFSHWFYVATWGTGGHFGVDLLRNWDFSTADAVTSVYWLPPNTMSWDSWVLRDGIGGVRKTYPMTLSAGGWHRLDVVIDGGAGVQCLYIDGAFMDSSAVAPATTFAPENVVFGDLSWAGDPGDGHFDDLSILALDLVPPDYRPEAPVPPGETSIGESLPLSLSITVRNAANASANATATVAFFNESTPNLPFTRVVIPPLGAGGFAGPVTATWRSPGAPGTYRIVADVDYDGNVSESNETNNRYAWTVTVYAPAPQARVENWKPVVALVFALVLALVAALLAWRASRRNDPAGKSVVVCGAAFAVAEAVTGIVSALTGALAIPPVLGIGTIVDVAILAVGLAVAGVVAVRARPPLPPAPRVG